MSGPSKDLAELERKAQAGDAHSQYMLSAILGRMGRRIESRAWLSRSGEAGNVDALYTTACLLLDGVDGARDTKRAVEILRNAASRGGGAALRTLAVLTAMGVEAEANWASALALLSAAAVAGDAPAQKQLRLIGSAAFERSLPQRQTLSNSPNVWRLDGLLLPQECDHLVEAVTHLLHESFVVDPVNGHPIRSIERTSSTASVHPLQQDMVIYCINRRIADATGLPSENGEMLSVLKYEPGEQYSPHFDFLDGTSGSVPQWSTAGQRIATLLVSLNAEFEGGETRFLGNGLTYKGGKGDAILFWNVDSAGVPDLTTRHAGLPVTSGTKWLLSKWFREKPFAN